MFGSSFRFMIPTKSFHLFYSRLSSHQVLVVSTLTATIMSLGVDFT